MNTTCETCGNTLHSGLSRALGRCGACRLGEEGGIAFTPPPADLAGRRPASASGSAPRKQPPADGDPRPAPR